MRTGAAATHRGYFHEGICYASDEEFLAVVVPFLLGGVAAGEPTVVSLGEEHAALVHQALPEPSSVTFMAGGPLYARPAAAIKAYRHMLAAYVAAGAHQIRIIGELPLEALGNTWDTWARYESAINHAYDEFPLWSMCAYDTRVTPVAVLDEVARTHPRHALPGDRHVDSDRYQEPAVYLRELRAPVPDPVQSGPPVVELADPSPVGARNAVHYAAKDVLATVDLSDLVLAVSEVVTNATRHGVAPVRVRTWAGQDRVIVEVTDGGSGPDNPYAGLLPLGDGSAGGLGLWLAHQLCNHVTLTRSENGFSVRLTAGNPHERPEPDRPV